MNRRRVAMMAAALGVALMLSGSAVAAATRPTPAKSYPTGAFTVAGHRIQPGDILDARAIPDLTGKPSLMVTLSAQAVAAIAPGHDGRLDCTLDGKSLGQSPADALATDHVLQLSGDYGSYDVTAALARRISGRDPLPDSEGDD